jgi:hypothetical protein
MEKEKLMNNEKLGSNFHPDEYLKFRRFSIPAERRYDVHTM